MLGVDMASSIRSPKHACSCGVMIPVVGRKHIATLFWCVCVRARECVCVCHDEGDRAHLEKSR